MNNACRIVFGLGLGLALLLVAAKGFAQEAPKSKTEDVLWSEEKWPFPLDQWGTGMAFRCAADKCGSEMHLYLQAKIGFCRCATGVSDDDEIDRVGDVELIGPDYQPLAPGHAVTAGIMTGRARRFAVNQPFGSSQTILTLALAHSCDAIVATITAEPDIQSAIQPATQLAPQPVQETNALDFLRTAGVQDWVKAQHSSQ
jgi:hypothetical protein